MKGEKLKTGGKKLWKVRRLHLNADIHAGTRGQKEVRRRGKGGTHGGRAPGRGCRQTGRETRGRR